MACLLQFIWN